MAINVYYGNQGQDYQQEMNSQEIDFLQMSHELIVIEGQECVGEHVKGWFVKINYIYVYRVYMIYNTFLYGIFLKA